MQTPLEPHRHPYFWGLNILEENYVTVAIDRVVFIGLIQSNFIIMLCQYV